ncbi:MAG TPA: hypothetical protein VIK52_07180 [Opitutaceae bacterium]
MKTFDPDDPLLTAYALGELEGDELREIEALIARDPAAARHVESIRSAAAGFGEAFEREPALEVEPIRPVEIEPKRRVPFIPWLFYASTAAAACFFVVLIVRLADPAALTKDANLAAEAPIAAPPPAPTTAEDRMASNDEGAAVESRQQPSLFRKEKSEVSDSAVVGAEATTTAKRANAYAAARERDDADSARKASAPAPPLGEMKDAAKGGRAGALESEVLKLDQFEVSTNATEGAAVLGDLRAKLDSGEVPQAINAVALLAELGLQETPESQATESGNLAAQMAVTDSPMPDPEAALVRAVEGFARLVAARTPSGDEAWDRVLANARYAAGSDPRRLTFVELVGETRDAIAALGNRE